MRFKIHVKNEKHDWWEEDVKNITDPNEYGKVIVDEYNRTLRTGEFPRTFIEAEIIDADEMEETREYETERCEECLKFITVTEYDDNEGLCVNCYNDH